MSWKFELLAKPYGGVTEGPVWDGEAIYFTHIPTGRIMRHDPRSDAITEWRTGTNRTNGLAFDLEGRLYGCCSGGRAIVRFDPEGQTATIADRLEGKRFNTPLLVPPSIRPNPMVSWFPQISALYMWRRVAMPQSALASCAPMPFATTVVSDRMPYCIPLARIHRGYSVASMACVSTPKATSSPPPAGNWVARVR